MNVISDLLLSVSIIWTLLSKASSN